MAAFSSAGQVRRRPAPVNTSMRRARSRIGVSSEIDMCRSSEPAPNFTPHAWLRKALPRRRLLLIGAGTPKEAVARGWCVLILLPTSNGAADAAILIVLLAHSA